MAILPKKQIHLLKLAGQRDVERRKRNGHAFDELVRQGFINTEGKTTAKGRVALRRILWLENNPKKVQD